MPGIGICRGELCVRPALCGVFAQDSINHEEKLYVLRFSIGLMFEHG